MCNCLLTDFFLSKIDAQSIDTSSSIQESVALSKEVCKKFKVFLVILQCIDIYL